MTEITADITSHNVNASLEATYNRLSLRMKTTVSVWYHFSNLKLFILIKIPLLYFISSNLKFQSCDGIVLRHRNL